MNWLTKFLSQEEEIIVKEEEVIDNGPTVVWLHGANQSHLSFEYLRSRTNFKKEILINYSSANGFYNNLADILIEVKNQGPLFVVGHSLGGVYALHLLKHVEVVGGVSISTPFRGSSAADWAKYLFPSYPLFRDVGRRSKPILEAKDIEITVPWTQVVSTTGSVPYLKTANDGVVTIDSMRSRNDMEFISVAHTHYEVVCSENVSNIIAASYNRVAEVF